MPENIGTNMRTMNFVRFFKNHGFVDIAYSRIMPGGQTENPIFSHEYFLEQEVAESFQDRLIRWINIKRRPFPIRKYTDASERQLLSIIESNDYDYIFVRYIYNTSSLFKLLEKYKMRTIIDFDDILSGSLYESEIVSANGYLRRLRFRLNQRLLMNYEKRCLNFGASLFCSKEDMSRVAGNCNRTNTFVIPNIYDNYSFRDYNFGSGFGNNHNLLFVGTLRYKPNIDGLKWFIESVFPDFKKDFPDAKLLVIGHSKGPEIENLCKSRDGIEIYTNVSDIKEYYKKCRVAIVPLFTGSGTRIKILEAAFAGRPVLSTPIGAEGLEFLDNRDLLLFNNASDFIRQYQKILNKEKYLSLTNNAKQIVTSKYSIDNFNPIMQKIITDLAQ